MNRWLSKGENSRVEENLRPRPLPGPLSKSTQPIHSDSFRLFANPLLSLYSTAMAFGHRSELLSTAATSRWRFTLCSAAHEITSFHQCYWVQILNFDILSLAISISAIPSSASDQISRTLLYAFFASKNSPNFSCKLAMPNTAQA